MIEFVRCPRHKTQIVDPDQVRVWKDETINMVLVGQGVIRPGQEYRSAECPLCGTTLGVKNFFQANDEELLEIIVQLQSA